MFCTRDDRIDGMTSSKRLEREKRTVAVMISMYCRGVHNSPQLCPECAALLAYALQRIEKCPFGADKPTCANCTIHCYAGPGRGGVSRTPDMREQVRAVMRYSGPRMLLSHPILALMHLWDGRKRRS
jgi:hypothetical protein